MYAALIALNVVAWLATALAALRYPPLLGLGLLAYGFGLRHAVDPDHIAAIDNTTRKLMQDGRKPIGVGFFFSLGHSTVVFALCAMIAFSAAFVQQHLAQMQSLGGVIGTSVSGVFLLLIAAVNAFILIEIFKTWRRLTRGGEYDQKTLEGRLNSRGLIARVLGPMLRIVQRSWHMYPVGFLFGLGFDTASEVGVLGITAATALGPHSMPAYLILTLPLLFAAGMSLLDTTDGIAMLGAYGWAFVKPVRKLYYNMTLTLVSVVAALAIGGVEIVQVVTHETGVRGAMANAIAAFRLDNAGFFIIGIFLAYWAGSAIYYKVRRADRLDSAAASQ